MRGLIVFKEISKLFSVDIYLATKNLNTEILRFLKKNKITFILIKKIDTSLIDKTNPVKPIKVLKKYKKIVIKTEIAKNL